MLIEKLEIICMLRVGQKRKRDLMLLINMVVLVKKKGRKRIYKKKAEQKPKWKVLPWW